MNDALLLQWIQQCIANERFHFNEHALTKHTVTEGFRARHAIEAIERGTIIERRDSESRCLVCGEATGLKISSDYVGDYIHCSIEWSYVDGVVSITMYRPMSSEWVNQFTRRRKRRYKPDNPGGAPLTSAIITDAARLRLLQISAAG